MKCFFSLVALFLLTVWGCSSSEAQNGFSGMVKPLDCADYTGTDSDYSHGFTTLYRDTEDGRTTGYYEGIGSHPGVDIARLSDGQGDSGAPIRAVYDGVVASVLYNTAATNYGHGWGNCLIIRHTDIPDAGTIYSCYGHMVGFNGTWTVGQSISKGQIIGYVGTTGNSTGPHLHFQIDKDYSDYSGFHPWFPSGQANVNTPDTTGNVLNHTINPLKFVQDHLNAVVVSDTEIYVSTSGSDSNNGSSGFPLRTVARAIVRASSTQPVTIHITPGVYSEKISTSKHIHFVTNGSGTVRIGG